MSTLHGSECNPRLNPAMACIAQIKGKGFAGYEEAILLLKEYVQGRRV